MNRQEHYRREYRRIKPGWQDSLTRYRAYVGALLGEATRVLDLGCGSAGCLRELCARTPHIYGLDLDRAALRRNTATARLSAGTGERLPFGDDTFDLVTLAWVLEHLNELQQVARELCRVLRPGGQIVFLTPNAWNYNVWLIRAVPNACTPSSPARYTAGASARPTRCATAPTPSVASTPSCARRGCACCTGS